MPFLTISAVLLSVLFVYLPETKGRPVEDVAEMLGADGAWNGEYNARYWRKCCCKAEQEPE